ncbi:MAG: hypothetical protein HYV07_23730 [Deltaproteobacteria bacterium]|nr:hypothetical protein [Deltaproteobacteria bacterium]
MSAARGCLIAVLTALLCGSAAAGPTVLVASKKKEPRFRPAFVAALETEGIEVRQAELRPKAKAVDAGKKAKAHFVVVLAPKTKKDKGSVKVDLFDVSTGEKLKSQKASWKNAKEAAKSGSSLGELFAGAILAAQVGGGEAQEPEPKPRAPIVLAPTAPEEEPAPDPEPPRPVLKDEIDSPVVADPVIGPIEEETARPEPTSEGEGRRSFISLEIGSQASTSYTVSVGEASTRLGYSLSPLLMLGARGRFELEPIEIAASLAAVPVKYVLDIDPPITPPDPSGLFFLGSAHVGFPLTLSGEGRKGIRFTPSVGFGIELLDVEEQSQPIVLSSSALGPELGLGLAVDGESLDLGLLMLGRLIVGFGESPNKSGEFAGGIAAGISAEGRYWLTSAIAVSLGVGFRFHSVSLSGNADRLRLQDDPELVDAKLGGSSLSVGVGFVYAL